MAKPKAPKTTRTRIEAAIENIRAAVSTIHYASVLPGTGKTYWAIENLATRIIEKRDITLYVAPTHALLDEVERSLKKKVPKNQHSMIHRIGTSRSFEHHHNDSATQRLRIKIEGGINSFKVQSFPAPIGSVILCTHEAFIRLPHNVINGKPALSRRPEVSVIFDEARKCTASVNKSRLPLPVVRELFAKYIRMVEPKGSAPGTFPKSSGYHRLEVIGRDTAQLDELFARTKATRQARSSLVDILKEAMNDATSLYGSLKLDATGRIGNSAILQTVIVPYQLFQGWKQVLLLSAFFESSQMYHLLKAREVNLERSDGESMTAYKERLALALACADESVRLVDVTKKIVNTKRVKAVRARYKQTAISYLSEHTSFSQRQLTNGVMVDSDFIGTPAAKEFTIKYLAMLEKKDTLKGKTPKVPLRYIVSLIRHSKDSTLNLSQADKEIIKHVSTLPGLEKMRYPLEWYAAKASIMSTFWYAKNDKEVQPLPITCNTGGADRPYVRAIDTTLPEDTWIEMPMRSQGLNKFKSYDTLAFLATLNPRPEVVALMNQLCPEYDPKLDHTIDQCIQSATRCSIRNTKSTSKPLIIVTDRQLAEGVRDHLCGLPKIIKPIKLGVKTKDPLVIDYVPSDRKTLAEVSTTKLKRLRAVDAERAGKYRKNNKELLAYLRDNSKFLKESYRLTTMLSRYRKAGKDTAKVQEELAIIRRELKVERPRLVAAFKKQNSK